jgi:hypothetical protein
MESVIDHLEQLAAMRALMDASAPPLAPPRFQGQDSRTAGCEPHIR